MQLKNTTELHIRQMYEYILKIKEDGNVDIILQSSSFYDKKESCTNVTCGFLCFEIERCFIAFREPACWQTGA